PACRAPRCSAVRAVGGRESTARPRMQMPVLVSRATHVPLALGDVIKNTRPAHAVTVAGVARIAATRGIFGGGELVVNGIRVALTLACLLIYESLDACHDGRCE